MAAISESVSGPHFDATLARHGIPALSRKSPATIQVNVGKLCNQACHHCHVDAGPRRTEQMTRATAERVIEVLAASPRVGTLDITGGAPELNANFAMLVERARALGRKAIVRCNLTVTLEPGMEWLVEFYRRSGVELVCSLPCYTAENTDRQRGAGVFDKSIAALKQLNAVGFGRGELRLDLVYNPIGASLPPPQAGLEAQYRDELARNFGIVFDPAADNYEHADRPLRQSVENHRQPLSVHGLAGESLQPRDRGWADVPQPGERRMGRAALRLRF